MNKSKFLEEIDKPTISKVIERCKIAEEFLNIKSITNAYNATDVNIAKAIISNIKSLASVEPVVDSNETDDEFGARYHRILTSIVDYMEYSIPISNDRKGIAYMPIELIFLLSIILDRYLEYFVEGNESLAYTFRGLNFIYATPATSDEWIELINAAVKLNPEKDSPEAKIIKKIFDILSNRKFVRQRFV